MGEWRLEILGPPQIVRDGETVKRLRTKRDWGVLASLALEPGVNTRAALARRLWPEAISPTQNLRVALSSIRSALGPDILVETDGGLRLRSHSVTDSQEMRNAMRQAKRLTEITDAAQKAEILREAALLIRGPFLEGVETSEAFGWVEIQRERFRAESIDLLREWLAACQIVGDEAGIADAAQHLLMIDPDDEAAQNLLLQSRRPVVRRLNPKMNWSAVGAVLAPLPPINGGLGGPEPERLTVGDAITLHGLIEKRLASLPAALRRSLRLLSVFPDSFTAEQAEGVCGVVGGELERFVEAQLLPQISNTQHPIPNTHSRFTLRGPVRETLWRRLTGVERNRLAERHARFFAAEAKARCAEPSETFMPSLQDHIEWLQTEFANLSDGRDWFLSQLPEVDGVMMSIHLYEVIRRITPLNNDFLEPAFAYLTAYVEAKTAQPKIVAVAMETLFWMTANRHDAGEALKRVEQFISLQKSLYGIPPENYYLQSLVALHNVGNDAGFDRVATSALVYNFENNAKWKISVRQLVVENYMARRRFADALVHNDQCLAFLRAENIPLHYAHALYLRGCILKGLERRAEARDAWNEAMEIFETKNDQHSVANCLNGLATLCRESGALSEAKRHAIEAVALFRTVGDAAAVHVANAALGDILRDKGDPDAARALYEPGLAFWREKNHTRWIGIFEEKIAKLGINSQ